MCKPPGSNNSEISNDGFFFIFFFLTFRDMCLVDGVLGLTHLWQHTRSVSVLDITALTEASFPAHIGTHHGPIVDVITRRSTRRSTVRVVLVRTTVCKQMVKKKDANAKQQNKIRKERDICTFASEIFSQYVTKTLGRRRERTRKRWRMVRWWIWLTHLTLVRGVIRYCLVQVWQNLKKMDFLHSNRTILFS